MIEIAPFLRNRYQRALAQYQRFLDSVGTMPDKYSVAPQLSQGTIFIAVYKAKNFGLHSYITDVQVVAGSDPISFTTGLDNALFFMAEVFEGGARPAAPDPISGQSVLSQLKIEPEVMKPKVAGWTTGTFLAPDDDGFVCFSVDTHGEISIEARSENLSGVAVYLAGWQRAEAKNLSARIARFAQT